MEISAYLKCIIGRFDSGDVREQPKIVNVARPSCQRLHGEDVMWRGCHHAQPRMVENARFPGIIFARDIDARLLVQPPPWQPEFLGDLHSLFVHDPMRHEPCIDVAGHSVGVVSQGHRCTTDYKYVGDNTPPGKTLPRAVKARSGSARPKRTSPASLTQPPDRVRRDTPHACGMQLAPRPGHRPAESPIPRGTMAAAAREPPPTLAGQDHALRRDAQQAPPTARPI